MIDLPMAFHGTVKALASKFGEFVESEPSSFEFEGNYYRVRVRLDVRNPLKKETSLIHGGHREILALKYERLPDWCQVCGMMGHQFKERGDGMDPPTSPIFKNLRAPPTTSWGTKRRNYNQKAKQQDIFGDSDAGHQREDSHGVETMDMKVVDATPKRRRTRL
ncbi:hypothetical protein D1007_39374 [Hordeum vulgare]|nr:hypothetical protein D1007_39374 [Hordeum vulgare]